MGGRVNTIWGVTNEKWYSRTSLDANSIGQTHYVFGLGRGENEKEKGKGLTLGTMSHDHGAYVSTFHVPSFGGGDPGEGG